MNTASGNPLDEVFARILKKLGKMGDFFSLNSELSEATSGNYVRLFNWLMTQPAYANLKKKIVNQQFIALITQLANRDQQHEEAHLSTATAPSTLLKGLLDDTHLSALLPRLIDQNDLHTLLLRLTTNEAAPLVDRLAKDGVFDIARKFAVLPDDDPLITRMADDTTPFFATLHLLARHPEMDGLLSAILRLLANDPTSHTLPDDEDFARLVVDLAESPAVRNSARRAEFFDLAKGFADETESLKIGHKVLFTDRFTQVAAELADDDDLTRVVRRMQDEEDVYYKVAKVLKFDGDAAQTFLSLTEEPELAATVNRMCEDKAHPDGFSELVKELRTNPAFFQQSKKLAVDDSMKGMYDVLAERPLNGAAIAGQFCDLGDKLHLQGDKDQAITAYMLAMRLEPYFRRAYMGHARACMAKKYYTQAVEDYQTLTSKNDHDTAVHLELGQVYLQLNSLDQAAASFRKVLEWSTDREERRQADDGLSEIAHRL